jgi:mannose-6-phosphate isomerase-like protein (cupin superfamily)
MAISNTLQGNRSTKMYRCGDNGQKVTIYGDDSTSFDAFNNILAIVGELITMLPQMGVNLSNSYALAIPPQTPYMLINTMNQDFTIEFEEDPAEQSIIYDPYLMEFEDHQEFNPDEFKETHPVPDGYIDTLPKWYSIKFTYPDFNYIFVRPGLGISIQVHSMREEFWEVMEGHPIIIANAKVSYDTQPGDQFMIPLGAMHTVINPTQDWILIKEHCEGTFDEEDIVRIFNPNHYGQ